MNQCVNSIIYGVNHKLLHFLLYSISHNMSLDPLWYVIKSVVQAVTGQSDTSVIGVSEIKGI